MSQNGNGNTPTTIEATKTIADPALRDAVRYSVQGQRSEFYFGSSILFEGGYNSFGNSLPSIYSPIRQGVLARIDSHPLSNLWQGALARIAHKVSGTSAEISGKRRVKFFQDLIMFQSDEGNGFATLIEKIIHDFSVYDDGAVVEIIGRGDPSSNLDKEAIVGIRVLDPLRCFFTMNTEYPVWYQDSVTGKLHKMHYTRVHRFVDQARSDPELRGRGLSALSRAVGFVQQAIVTQTYVGEQLDENMPPGILLVNGVIPDDWKDAWTTYRAQNITDGMLRYKPMVEYIHPLSDKPVTIEFIPFSVAPQNFDPIKQTELQAKGIALGLDTDPNDILPIQGGNFGTGEQSKILDQKNRDGGFTHLLKMLERFFNVRILPDPLRFEWQYRDNEQSLQSADIANRHLEIAERFAGLNDKLGGVLDKQVVAEITMRYIADNVSSLSDAMRDEEGDLVQLFDDDPAEEVPDAQQIRDDVVTDPAANAPDAQTVTDNQTTPTTNEVKVLRTKDYGKTFDDFKRDLKAAVSATNEGETGRARAGTIIRALLAKYGRLAYADGLRDGGVEVDALDNDDFAVINSWLADQSPYVSDLTARIWSTDEGLSPVQVDATVSAWANKSLDEIYNNGIASADQNGLYEFVGDDGDESCDDCQRLKGKKFRMKDWIKSGYLPSDPNTKLSCQGFQCQHYIAKTSGRANSKSLIGL